MFVFDLQVQTKEVGLFRSEGTDKCGLFLFDLQLRQVRVFIFVISICMFSSHPGFFCHLVLMYASCFFFFFCFFCFFDCQADFDVDNVQRRELVIFYGVQRYIRVIIVTICRLKQVNFVFDLQVETSELCF